MPVERIPITHSFGIISSAYQEAMFMTKSLQEQTLEESKRSTTPRSFVTAEQFVEEFLGDSGEHCESEMLEKARVLFCRTARRAGISLSGCQNGSLEISRAWRDLILLSQCHGEIQTEALQLLLVCLDRSPLDVDLILSIFIVMRHVVRLLLSADLSNNKNVMKNFVRLKILFLSSVRLLYHHWVGHLTAFLSYLPSLVQCLKGLEVLDEAFVNYPGARLHLLFAVELSSLLVESSGVSTKASEDGDKPNPTVCRSLRADCTQSCDNIVGLHEQEQVVGLGEEMRCVSAPGDLYTVPTPPHNSVVQESIAGESASHGTHSAFDKQFSAAERSLSVLLVHAVEVWKHAALGSRQLEESLKVFRQHHMLLTEECWLYGVIILNILSCSALTSLPVLKLIQQLALSDQSDSRDSSHQQLKTLCRWPWQLAYSFGHCLGTIAMHTELSAVRKCTLEGAYVGCGALLLMRQHNMKEPAAESCSNWIIRYSAVESLARIAQKFKDSSLYDGFHRVAWSALAECEMVETDSRVCKAAQIGKDLQSSEENFHFCEISAACLSTGLFGQIASGLAHFYEHVETTREQEKQQQTTTSEVTQTNTTKHGKSISRPPSCIVREKKTTRPTIRDKLLEQVGLEHFNAVSRCARARAALNEIAEDDWRRQAESEIEDKQ
ncbi:uncharacterized protein LOC134197011 isoform X2 [Corticium candelabrum]|uniref:uncharacterized protein LOC134197011 isoform X2 n=1 Tax=Corticium candelabrum TaxID=121492 RepID=UPI002E269B51|nr:uncharacterized protein LOC134197011 isoform X2 [Corticium candelabrum]